MKKRFTIIEKLCIFALVFLIGLPFASALEFHAQKNQAANFTAPLINSSNTSIFAVGADNTAFYIHNGGDTAFTQAATNVTHISDGIYLFQLNQSEMNHNRIGILYNGTGVISQYLLINTLVKSDTGAILTDTDATIPATLAGLTNVTLAATQTGVTIPTVTTLTGHTAQTGDAYAIVNHGTYGNSPILTAVNTRGTSNLTTTDNIGINWADVSNPTTALNLTGTEILGVNTKTGYSLSAAGVQAIWDALTSALSTASSIGKLLVDNINAAITSRMATFTLPGNFSVLNITSDGNVSIPVADIWNYNISSISGVGYAGTELNSVASADPWSTTLPASYGNTSAGGILDRIRKNTMMR